MTDSNPLDLKGKVILVTGGAQGIGGATAQLCAERGAKVVIADFKREEGERARDTIRASNCHADFVPVDVREEQQVSAVFDFIRKEHGRLDGMVCAAGVLLGPWLQPEDMPLEVFERTLDVNIKGTFLCSKFATPLLEASGNGVIVVIASGAGVSGPSSSLAYGASKGGVNGFGMTLANHVKDRHVRVH